MKNADMPAVAIANNDGCWAADDLSTNSVIGITKREYFAARAPCVPLWFINECNERSQPPSQFAREVEWRYTYADVMCAIGDD